MELLKQLYRIYSPSGRERAIRKFLMGYMRRIPGVKVEKDRMGNLYATKGIAETYPCVVAHMDQVHEAHSRDFKVVETEDFIFAYSPRHRRQENLGADDKNGVWVCLKCLEKYPVLKVAFFVGEEAGCVGSGEAWMDFFRDCRFVVEADRRGKEDLITSIGWTGLCSREFLKATEYSKFGYQETDGLMTDILALKENGLPSVVSTCPPGTTNRIPTGNIRSRRILRIACGSRGISSKTAPRSIRTRPKGWKKAGCTTRSMNTRVTKFFIY